MVSEPVGVPELAVLELEEPDPHAVRDSAPIISNSRDRAVHNDRFQRDARRGVIARLMIPAKASVLAGIQGVVGLSEAGPSIAVAAVVVIMSVVDAADPFDGVTLAGEKVQVASAGKAPQENLRVPEYPPIGVTVNINVADCPALMVDDIGLPVTV
jgi:hypothetical protein